MWWGGGGDLDGIFVCSHVPMERFFDETDQENSKTQGRKWDRSGIVFKKNKKEKEWRKEKEEIFHVCTWRFPYSCVLSIG
jgi:hypothetical protein